MTAADDAIILTRRTDAPVRPADAIALVEEEITPLSMPAAYADRHCPECGMLEPHHQSHCPWKEL